DTRDGLEAAQRVQCGGDAVDPQVAGRSHLPTQAAQHLLVEDRRGAPDRTLVDDQPHRVRPDVDNADRLPPARPALPPRYPGLRLFRALLALGEAEPARAAVLQPLPTPRQARIGHEVFVGVERLLTLRRPNPLRPAVRQDAPALLVVLEIRNHDLVHDLLVHRRVGNRHHDLHAPIEIARHHVGGADIDEGPRRRQAVAGAEAVDAAVLQETADDALCTDVLRQSGHARSQAADAAHDEVDLHAGLTRLVQRIDDLRIDQRVELHPDGALAPGLGMGDLVADVRQETGADALRAGGDGLDLGGL